MCETGKMEYGKKEAKSFVNLRAGQLNKDGYLRAYPCQLCNKWHVTKQRNQHDCNTVTHLKYANKFKKYIE